jgi:hypothetical protein
LIFIVGRQTPDLHPSWISHLFSHGEIDGVAFCLPAKLCLRQAIRQAISLHRWPKVGTSKEMSRRQSAGTKSFVGNCVKSIEGKYQAPN